MKKISLVVLLLVGSFGAKAQSYVGFLTDNYSGVNSVIANPANITDSRFKTDINIVGVSAFAGNDYYGVNLLDALKDDYDFDLDAKKSPSTDNNAAINLDVMGPAFMFNLTETSSLAIFTRARSMVNVTEINGETIDNVDNDTTDDFVVNEGDFTSFAQAWAEVGVTYARVLMNKEEHFLKGGLTVKYLQGGGTAYAYGKNVTVDYDADGTNPTTGSLDTTGELTYGYYDDFDNDDYDYELPDASGFGADLGFVYEWRPDYRDYQTESVNGPTYNHKDQNKYKLKIGLSITDIGQINYKEGTQEVFDINGANINEDDFDNGDDFADALENIYGIGTVTNGYKVKLPTAVHLNADYSFTKRFFLNLNTDFSLIAKGKEKASRIANMVSLTPRFESKWFSFYVPVSLVQYNGFQAGAGFRAGPLYIGSGSVITALASDNTKGADVYAGLKVPVYQGKPKDRDNDGVIDKLDGCPKEAGPAENNGCPWLDSDVDGVMDNEDNCPEVAGPKENKGCPWGDTDNDGVLDNVDICPKVVGPVENSGCPWKDTDNDGVADKFDECVDVAGTVANKGCPEVIVPTVEVQATLNAYAKTILFNSGKSSIKTESNKVLAEIVNILGEYPDAKFSIEGHTDSSGGDTLNQRLSDARANAVKTYLVKNGVDEFRLSAIGFGETRPIATNATSAGRADNRRVEINLVK
jgi:outer membrane protein OmpA-like peptidoglycan-associated protein